VSPTNNAINQPISLLPLVWTHVSTANTYHFKIATSSNFTNIFLEDSTLTDTMLSVGGLANGVTYYWRVRAKDAAGVSPWTSSWQFTTVIIPPSAPALVVPADSAIIVMDSLRLIWNIGTPAVDRYLVEVALDSAMTNFVTQDSSVTDTTRLMTSLVNNTTYYWRVKAHNAAGWGDYSAETRFVTSFTGVLFNGNASHAFSLKYASGTLRYTLPAGSFVSVRYYDIRGRLVGSYINKTQGAGSYSLRLPLSSFCTGAYVQVFTAGEIVRKDRIMLMR
jgi:hypothetical protein